MKKRGLKDDSSAWEIGKKKKRIKETIGGLSLRRKIKFGFKYVKSDLPAGQEKWGFE